VSCRRAWRHAPPSRFFFFFFFWAFLFLVFLAFPLYFGFSLLFCCILGLLCCSAWVLGVSSGFWVLLGVVGVCWGLLLFFGLWVLSVVGAVWALVSGFLVVVGVLWVF
jgi:hypothetical protein